MAQARGGDGSSHGGNVGAPLSPDEAALRQALLSDDAEPLAELRAVLDRLDQESRREPSEIAELRRLLFGPDLRRLDSVQSRIENPSDFADAISRVLAEAVALRNRRDQTLRTALAPTVEDALRVSIRKNPKVLADALFPVIGPAIRRAIAAALAGMVESLNQTLERSFSLQGLKWRLEARAAGRPFAEVVLSHTLIYQVEQVFLIHRTAGLVLCHVARRPETARDPDLVSGMLTAIQDFVHDSFAAAEGDALETLRVGDQTVRIEQGPHAALAAVIRGAPPANLRATFLEALESVHLEYGRELEAFDGDATPFEPCRATLELCLQARYGGPSPDAKSFRPVIVFAALAALFIAVPLGVWSAASWREDARWTRYLTRLRAEPGVVVTAAERAAGRAVIIGLRDPLASDPLALAREVGFDAAHTEFRWEPYFSFAPSLVAIRARQTLRAPDGVRLTLDGDVLRATGTAPRRWIDNAKSLEFAIPGVVRLDADNVQSEERIALQHLGQNIEDLRIRFPLGGDAPEPGQDETLTRLRRDVEELRRLAGAAGARVILRVIGRTDALGAAEFNRRLGRTRAERIRAALDATADETFAVEPAADDRETNDGSASAERRREVRFQIVLTEGRPALEKH
jgi:OOP family OmpA-OmpF porin